LLLHAPRSGPHRLLGSQRLRDVDEAIGARALHPLLRRGDEAERLADRGGRARVDPRGHRARWSTAASTVGSFAEDARAPSLESMKRRDPMETSVAWLPNALCKHATREHGSALPMKTPPSITSPYAPDLEHLRAWLQKMIAALRFAELVVAV